MKNVWFVKQISVVIPIYLRIENNQMLMINRKAILIADEFAEL